MIGIVIATHADLGQGIIDAIELIAGKQTGVAAVGLHHGDGIEAYEQRVLQALNEVDSGGGVLCFVDFLGGTPANTMLKCIREKNILCVTGVNMPMVLEALTNQHGCSPAELELQCIEAGKDSILKLEDILNNMENAFAEITEDEF